jgi:toxin FitB
MIILDTNVISELMRGPNAERRVLTWARSLGETPATTVINRAELLAGLAVLPEGARQSDLRRRAEETIAGLVDCLALLPGHAATYGAIVATRKAQGRPIGAIDGLIASIARDSRSRIATRDTAGFAGLGLELVDPWA